MIRRFAFILLALFSASYVQSQVDSNYILKCSGACKHSTDNATYLPYNQFLYAFQTDADLGEFNWIKDQPAGSTFIRLSIQPDCWLNMTRILWEYMVHDSIIAAEVTGIIDNKKEIWLLPPRSLIDEVFYSFYYHVYHKKQSWSSGQLKRTNHNPYDSTKKWVKGRDSFTVTGDTTVLFNNESVTCRNIQITSKYHGKTCQSYMLFHETYGVMVVDAHFVNGKSYSLHLVDYDPNYCSE